MHIIYLSTADKLQTVCDTIYVFLGFMVHNNNDNNNNNNNNTFVDVKYYRTRVAYMIYIIYFIQVSKRVCLAKY